MSCCFSEMYPMAVIFGCWARNSFSVGHSIWLSCYICNNFWTFAILCSVLSTTSFFISELFPVFVVSTTGSAPADFAVLAWANSLTMGHLRKVSPVVPDCLQQITSWPTEKMASTLIPCGMVVNLSHDTLERSSFFHCVFSRWHHQSVISGIQYGLTITIGSKL
jgi:hypothetical protein